MVHAMGISIAMVRFLREWAEDKGEERRGGPLDEAGVRVVMSSKGERRERKRGVVTPQKNPFWVVNSFH